MQTRDFEPRHEGPRPAMPPLEAQKALFATRSHRGEDTVKLFFVDGTQAHSPDATKKGRSPGRIQSIWKIRQIEKVGRHERRTVGLGGRRAQVGLGVQRQSGASDIDDFTFSGREVELDRMRRLLPRPAAVFSQPRAH